MNYTDADSVQIHLHGQARWAARIALLLQRKLSLVAALQYSGPTFITADADNVSVAVGHSTVNVLCFNGDTGEEVEYIYPLAVVARIKIIQ